MKTIAIACDHAGFELKQSLIQHLKGRGDVTLVDLGTHSMDSVDYPDYGAAAAQAILDGKAELGIVICGTGIGISIAANRFKGIRSAPCHDVTSARLARQHNNANILAIGARLVGVAVACDCVDAFLDQSFQGGRHQRRVDMLG